MIKYSRKKTLELMFELLTILSITWDLMGLFAFTSIFTTVFIDRNNVILGELIIRYAVSE